MKYATPLVLNLNNPICIRATAGESLVNGNVVALHTDGKAWKATATTAGKKPCFGVCIEDVATDGTALIAIIGYVATLTIQGTTPSVGSIIYLSDVTSGAGQVTAPADSGELPQIVAQKMSNGYLLSFSLNNLEVA